MDRVDLYWKRFVSMNKEIVVNISLCPCFLFHLIYYIIHFFKFLCSFCLPQSHSMILDVYYHSRSLPLVSTEVGVIYGLGQM